MYTMRQASDADFAFLYNLYSGMMKDYVAQIWSWDETIQPNMLKDRSDPEHTQLVVVDGRDVGLLSMERRSCRQCLSNIQILPEEQRHGMGMEIIETTLSQAYREGRPVVLQVLKVNPARHL